MTAAAYAIVRREIGPNRRLKADAHQRLDVPQAIADIRQLADFDSLIGSKSPLCRTILSAVRRRQGRRHLGTVTGKMVQNGIVFEHLMQLGAIRFCQVETCRLGGLS